MTIIDDIKARANIIEVIGADVKLKETGSSYTGFCPFHTNKQTPALVVYPNNGDDGYFKCFACGEHGDVIHYVEKRNPGWDTKEAMHFLAEKYGIEMREEKTPVTGRISAATAAEIRNVAMGVFKRWLVGETDRKTKEVLRKGDATALEYALDRGWTVETLRFEGIGFSGNGTEAERKEMTDEFRMYGIDPLCPDAVMVLGMRVDPSTSSGQSVAKWAEKYELDESAFRGDQTRIMGFMDVPALMYAHRFGGRVEYMSARYLPEFEKKWGRKSHNPNSALAGSKRCYRNSLYREHHLEGQEKGALLYIVEGQGDAVTGRQFGVPMVALCGAQWIYLMESGEVAEWKRDYEEFIYVTDADKAGQEVVTGQEFKFDLSTALGAMLWVGRTENKSWKRPSGNEKSIKDINDIAQYLRDTKAEEKESNRIFNSIRMGAERIVAVAARYAGTLDGQAKTTTLDKVLKPMILSVPDEQRVLLERDLAMALYPNLPKANALSDFRKWLRAQVKAAQASGDEDEKLEEVETFGGWYPSRENKDSGHLVEVYYDRETEKLRLAWAHITSLKNNVREIGWGKTLTLEDKILLPPEYDATIQDGIQFHSSALKVPAKVGEKVSTAEIIKRFSNFYQKYFYSEDKSKFKFCAVWSANSHLYDCFDIINILRAMGPPGSGKSDLMYLVGLTSYRFAVTAATSSPMSHVGLAKLYHATDMIDEYDSAMKRDDGTLASYLKARPMRRIAHSFKMMEVMSGSTRTFIPGNTPIYGPTMVTGYKKFEDKGLESRCLTFDLTKTDMILLDENGYEPGFYPPELEEEGEELRNIALRWRLENWLPRIELTKEEGKAHKLNDVQVDARENQLLRSAKVMAIKQNDMELLDELFAIGRANFDDQLLEAAGSFEAMTLRAILAADIAKDVVMEMKPKASTAYAERVKGYAELVKIGKLGHHGTVRYILYKHAAKILNEMFDLENLADDVSEDDKKKRRKTQSKTVGDICRDSFRMPVERTGNGWAIVLDKERLKIARMRLGLDREAEYDENYVEETPMPSAASPQMPEEQESLDDAPKFYFN